MSRPIPIEEMVEMFKRNHRTSHLFKIDNFSLLTKYKIEKVESSVFILGGHKWKLFVYPNGYNNANGHVSIFLQNQASLHVNLKYQVYVVSQLEPKWHPNFNVKWYFGTSLTSTMKGIHKLISLVDLVKNGYLIGDCCMFGASLVGFEPGTPGTAECFSLIEKPLNHKITWMMTKFSSFDPEKVHHSNEFVVGNRKWMIELHPIRLMGSYKSFAGCLTANGFINNAPKTKTFAIYKLWIWDQIKQNHVERTGWNWFDAEAEHDDDNKWFEDFMAHSKLGEPYLVNDKLYVGVEFQVISMTNYC